MTPDLSPQMMTSDSSPQMMTPDSSPQMMTPDSDSLFQKVPNESGVKSHNSWFVHSLLTNSGKMEVWKTNEENWVDSQFRSSSKTNPGERYQVLSRSGGVLECRGAWLRASYVWLWCERTAPRSALPVLKLKAKVVLQLCSFKCGSVVIQWDSGLHSSLCTLI